MSDIKGELTNESCTLQSVTWKVPNFFDLPSEHGYCLESPRFIFADATWCLGMFPNGSEEDETNGYIDVLLTRLFSSVAEHVVSYNLGFKTNSGKEYESYQCEKCFNADESVGGVIFYQERSVVKEKSDELVPGGTLTVFCHMRLMESSSGEMSKAELGENSSVVTEQSLHEKEEQKESSSGMWKLQSDYKKLLESGKESDVCLVVSGKEFRAHRCILRARSPVFDAMFNHGTEEKESGRVKIDDLDPESFHHFLEHVYTGRVETLTDEYASGLYTAADKYDVQPLKSDCVQYMQRTLSVDSFCDVMTLALKYHEKELMDSAVEFFKENLSKIILTVKWQLFLSDNSTKANELLIKALVPAENQ